MHPLSAGLLPLLNFDHQYGTVHMIVGSDELQSQRARTEYWYHVRVCEGQGHP